MAGSTKTGTPRVPRIDAPDFDAFCKTLSPTNPPLLVPLRPIQNAEVDLCHVNVQRALETGRPGTKVQGWIVWEMPYGFYEAIHHSLILLPDGAYEDPTPQSGVGSITHIAFVRDDETPFDLKTSVPAKYHQLRQDDDVAEYIKNRNAYNAIDATINADVGPTDEQRKMLHRMSDTAQRALQRFIARHNSEKVQRFLHEKEQRQREKQIKKRK